MASNTQQPSNGFFLSPNIGESSDEEGGEDEGLYPSGTDHLPREPTTMHPPLTQTTEEAIFNLLTLSEGNQNNIQLPEVTPALPVTIQPTRHDPLQQLDQVAAAAHPSNDPQVAAVARAPTNSSNIDSIEYWKETGRKYKENPEATNMFKGDELEAVKNSYSNSVRYEKGNDSLENRFFCCLHQYGDQDMKSLCDIVQRKECFTKDRRFYEVCGGKPIAYKKTIIDRAVALAMIRLENSKKPGEPMRPTTLKQYIKQLFGTFRKKGIEYVETDFKGKGEFHAVILSDWQKKREVDSTYGDEKNRELDHKADQKFIDACTKEGKLQPFKKYFDLIDCVVYALGRYWGFRGCTEIAYLAWKFVVFGTYEDGPDQGMEYATINIGGGLTKSNKWNLSNPTIKKDAAAVTVRANPNNPFGGYELLKELRRVTPPNQERVFSPFQSKKQAVERRENGLPYLSNPNLNIGKNSISDICQSVAKVCGFINWEAFTNHSTRALCVTTIHNSDVNVGPSQKLKHSRHSSLKSAIPYMRNNAVAASKLQDALAGNAVPMPKKAPVSNDTVKENDPPKVEASRNEKENDPPTAQQVQITALQKTNASKGDDIAALEDSIETLQGNFTAFQSASDENVARLKSSHEENVANIKIVHEKKIDGLEDEIDSAERRISGLKRDLDTSDEKYYRLKKEKKRLKNKVEELKKENLNLQMQAANNRHLPHAQPLCCIM